MGRQPSLIQGGGGFDALMRCYSAQIPDLTPYLTDHSMPSWRVFISFAGVETDVAIVDTALLSAGVSPDSFDFEEQRLAEAFRELPLMRRRILEMLFVEDLTPSEIAAKLHCSVQHVYNQRSLAIKRLRERLIKERKNDR